MAVLLLAGCALAQTLETIPDSPDPLLRVAPLERERIRPEPTPDLAVRSLPGRQAIVLPDRPLPGRLARPPVVLQLPAALFARTTAQASEQWGAYFTLRYPEMLPWYSSGPDCLGWCSGKMMLSLMVYPQPIPQFRADRVRADLQRQATVPESERLKMITNILPAQGYTKAYEEFFPKLAALKLPARNAIYIRERESNVDLFTSCSLSTPSPSCETSFQSNANPTLTVTFDLSHSYLGDITAIQQQIADWVDITLQPRDGQRVTAP